MQKKKTNSNKHEPTFFQFVYRRNFPQRLTQSPSITASLPFNISSVASRIIHAIEERRPKVKSVATDQLSAVICINVIELFIDGWIDVRLNKMIFTVGTLAFGDCWQNHFGWSSVSVSIFTNFEKCQTNAMMELARVSRTRGMVVSILQIGWRLSTI